MNKDDIKKCIYESVKEAVEKRTKTQKEVSLITDSTNLVGKDSILDSLSFIIFECSLEKKLNERTGRDYKLDFSDYIMRFALRSAPMSELYDVSLGQRNFNIDQFSSAIFLIIEKDEHKN